MNLSRRNLQKFLADFTLGFADGLTVPFALTAGLSSLGRSDTVIYAGLAEVCAGSISMGIGGFLSARASLPPTRRKEFDEEEEGAEDMEMLMGNVGDGSSERSGRESVGDEKMKRMSTLEKEKEAEMAIRRHLRQVLTLPVETTELVLEALTAPSKTLSKGGASLITAAERLGLHNAYLSEPTQSAVNCASPAVSPVISGLSIGSGYAVGGLIPLLPYFLAGTVGEGLMWSIFVCSLALFGFGFGKTMLLEQEDERRDRSKVWKCVWEGLQMLVLGTLAAAVAVGCVKLVGGVDESR